MQPLDEDWKLLLGLLPLGWEQQAILSGASERLRGFGSTSDLLRTLLLHVGKGYSLRETVVRAKAVGIAQVSASSCSRSMAAVSLAVPPPSAPPAPSSTTSARPSAPPSTI